MPLAESVHVSSVLILKSDRLIAEVLRQYTMRVFPRAKVRLVSSVEAAALALAAAPVNLLVTGVGAMLDGDVLELLSRSAIFPTRAQRVLVVTALREYRMLASLRALAVNGVFDSAGEAPDQFETALHIVAIGGRYWSTSMVDHLKQNGAANNAVLRLLTAFEQVVLSVIGDGSDDNVAAGELGLSPATVSTVRRDLHRKLGVQHRGELVRIAAQHGFVRFTSAGVVRPGFALLSAAYRARKPRRPSPNRHTTSTHETSNDDLSPATAELLGAAG